jgi:hypothetical protein
MAKWRQIDAFPNYEVSEDGRVRRCVKGRNRPTGYLLKPAVDRYGYLYYKLADASGKIRHATAHQLVTLTFIGPRPTPQHEAAHSDGNSRHNHWSNLSWKLPAGNRLDAVQHGSFSGERNGRARLTADKVLEMRRIFPGSGLTFEAIGAQYGIGETAAREAILGISWSHL